MHLKPLQGAVSAALLLNGLAAHAAELIDSTTLTISAYGSRGEGFEASRMLSGITDGSVSVSPIGLPSDPAAYRLDSTAANTNNFGKETSWAVQPPAVSDAWVIIDLGEDIALDSLAMFSIATTNQSRTARGVREFDLYYRTDTEGPGTNTDNDATAFDTTGWNFVAAQELSRTDASNTEIEPDLIDFSPNDTPITARYIGIDVTSNHSQGEWAGIAEILVFQDAPPANNDPLLVIDQTSSHFNYNFGDVLANEIRTITFTNQSSSGTATINLDTVELTDDGNGSFGTLVVVEGGTADNILSPGESATVSITATNANIGDVMGSLRIDTSVGGTGGTVDDDFNDRTFPLSATAFANNIRLNPNPLLDTNLAGWLGNAKNVVPGLASGSLGMARIPGIGDVDTNGSPASLTQTTVPDGAADFEFSAFFTPANAQNFENYSDAAGLGAFEANGSFTDRTFQWVLLGNDANAPNSDFADAQADATLINLAYMPAGVAQGGTPDFYVYDGNDWIATGIGAIVGSTDNDTDNDIFTGIGDGNLDPTTDPADVVNVYRLIVKGTGFGSAGASYTVTVTKVTGTDPFTTATSSALSAFHGLSGETNRPAGYAFTTADLSQSSNLGSGSTTPFWVDDVSFYNVATPDPILTVLSQPGLIPVLSPATSGSSSFIIRNDGVASSLDISSISLPNPSGFSVTSPVGSFSIAPGATETVTLQWDSTALTETVENSTLTLNSNSAESATTEIPLNAGIAVAFTDVIANGDFETPGADAVSDSDTFASWDEITGNDPAEDPIPENIIDVPNFVAGGPGSTSAYLQGIAGPLEGSIMETTASTPLNTFTLEFDFAISSTSGRGLSVRLDAENQDGVITLRYQSGAFAANAGSNTGFVDVLELDEDLEASFDVDGDGDLNDAGDVAVVYRLNITCTGWGSSDPFTVIEVRNSNGDILGTSIPFRIWNSRAPTNVDDQFTTLRMSQAFSSAPDLWLDNLSVNGFAIGVTPPPPAEELAVRDFTIDAATGAGSITFGSTDGQTYELRTSNDLIPASFASGTPIATTTATGESTTITFTDAGAAGQSKRFYRIEQVTAP